MTASAADGAPDASPSSIAGLVEGLAGAYLAGWAVDPRRSDPCEIVVVDDAGRTVARGSADRFRSDLAGYGFGRANCAFRLAIETLGSGGRLRVFADTVELAGSPLETGPGWYDGAVVVHDGWAEGWVHERRLGFSAPVVTLLDQDDTCLGSDAAILLTGDPLFTPARFRIALNQSAWRRPEIALRAMVGKTVFACTNIRLSLEGHLDVLSETRCAGWLLCPQAPSMRFGIQAFRDGMLVGSGAATLARADLREMHPASWKTGFDFDLLIPERGLADRPMTVSLRLADTDIELFEGPFAIGARRGLASMAKRVAGMTIGLPHLDELERTILQAALGDYIARCRDDGAGREQRRGFTEPPTTAARRLNVIIPVYRDVEGTRTCIESVLADYDPAVDAIILINDASPDPGMADMLGSYRLLPRVHVLTNATNCGFVQSVNRAFDFCGSGDVVLLNSDTVVFPGIFDELWSVARTEVSIGTVTALSNNATIFSYPVCDQGCDALEDITWPEVAAAALAGNRGRAIDVPTGHGFCMLVKRDLLDRVGQFDRRFGRGYGEENDLCLRGADLGFRNVAAAGVFVEHRESQSFGAEKSALLRVNLPLLQQRYPEYAAEVRDYLHRDDLRTARWTIDAHRLERCSAVGQRFVLVIRNWLDGGTRKAIEEYERWPGHNGATPLDLCVAIDGAMRLCCTVPKLAAVFAPGEETALLGLLESATVDSVHIHQLLGFGVAFVSALPAWIARRSAQISIHDYYSLCPRVTMIDAIGVFCDVAPVDVCARCIDLGGAHEASRMDQLSPAEHRGLFAELLHAADRVVAPSFSAAAYLRRAFPGQATTVLPHPEPDSAYDVPARFGSLRDVVLIGALGPHKGSAKLLEIVQRARLVAPQLRFHLIGYSDLDSQLIATGNIEVSGPYEPGDLAGLVGATNARIALFLHRWPETFSYTLSEAVQLGLAPLVPDIGAPAERVRAAGFGHVFAFPIDAVAVVELLVAIEAGRIAISSTDASPANFGRPSMAMQAALA